MTKVLIAFYSRGGMTEALANAVGEGAVAVGAEVRLRRAREVVGENIIKAVPGWAEHAARMNALYPAPTEDDAAWADAIVFGSPTRFGMVSSELKAFIDSLGALWFRGKLNLKVGSVFSSTSTLHGGNETTALTMFAPLTHFGMVIVSPGYGDPVMFKAGTPYGASAVGGGKPDSTPSAEVLEVARYQGRRVTQVAAAVKPLRG
jgi:NAD(P)H dehydrogenase (quinone)